MTSPTLRLHKADQAERWTEDLTKRTDPSHIRMFDPPG
jgi:hypothetical protein